MGWKETREPRGNPSDTGFLTHFSLGQHYYIIKKKGMFYKECSINANTVYNPKLTLYLQYIFIHNILY